MALDAGPFVQGLTKAKQSALSFNEGLNRLGTGLSVLGIVALAKHASDAAAELKRTALAVGTTVEELQGLGFAASQNGSSVEEMNKALVRLSANIGKAAAGDGEAIRKFEQYGIALRDVNGRALDTAEVMGQIADQVKAAGGGTAAAAVAFDLLGRSGVGLVQTLANGADGLAELQRLAEDTGNVVSTTANDAIVELADTLNRHLGGAISYVTDLAGKAIIGIKQLGVLAGELTADLNALDIAEALGNPVAALRVVAQLRDNFGGAIDAAQRVANVDEAQRAIENQVRDLEQMAPLLENVRKLEQERAEANEKLADKIDRLKREEANLTAALENRTEAEIRADAKLLNSKLDLLRKQKELQEANNKAVQQENKFREQSRSLQQSLADQMAKLAAAKQDRSKYTLEELATGNPFGVVSDVVRSDIFKSREAQTLQRLAEAARLRGDVPGSERLFNQADAVLNSIVNLRDSEKPFKGMEDSIRDLRDKQTEMLRLAQNEGINLKAITAV